MPLFAIAYVYDEFPRYDRVEHVGDRLRYFDKGVLVYQEPAPHWHVVKAPRIGLEFVRAETSNDAFREFSQKFEYHIIAATIVPVPKS